METGRKKRTAVCAAAVIAAVAVLLSLSCVPMLAEHECSGEDCRICLCISACVQALRGLWLCAAAGTAAAALACAKAGLMRGRTGASVPAAVLDVRFNE